MYRTNRPFGARQKFETGQGKASLYRLAKLQELSLTNLADSLWIRVLLEAALRTCDGFAIRRRKDIENLAGSGAPPRPAQVEIAFQSQFACCCKTWARACRL